MATVPRPPGRSPADLILSWSSRRSHRASVASLSTSSFFTVSHAETCLRSCSTAWKTSFPFGSLADDVMNDKRVGTHAGLSSTNFLQISSFSAIFFNPNATWRAHSLTSGSQPVSEHSLATRPRQESSEAVTPSLSMLSALANSPPNWASMASGVGLVSSAVRIPLTHWQHASRLSLSALPWNEARRPAMILGRPHDMYPHFPSSCSAMEAAQTRSSSTRLASWSSSPAASSKATSLLGPFSCTRWSRAWSELSWRRSEESDWVRRSASFSDSALSTQVSRSSAASAFAEASRSLAASSVSSLLAASSSSFPSDPTALLRASFSPWSAALSAAAAIAVGSFASTSAPPFCFTIPSRQNPCISNSSHALSMASSISSPSPSTRSSTAASKASWLNFFLLIIVIPASSLTSLLYSFVVLVVRYSYSSVAS
mmetsp:Transcript_4615/g.16563  ORF Transcript_4615/g.16563 Transcript_4615/m.16563 type:complete len:428 (+) Transcript_4615:898-2181(+)